MITRVRAKFAEGVLKPLDYLDLEEGCEVLVSIEGDGVQAVATDESSNKHTRVGDLQISEGPTGTPSSGYRLKNQREAARRLIAMGGSAPGIADIPRRKSNRPTGPGPAEGEDGR